jgi:hypothetical protein
MLRTAYDVVGDVLRDYVSEATENQIFHQLEYLRPTFIAGKYVLKDLGDFYDTDEGWNGRAFFLGPFANKEPELIPKIQLALRFFIDDQVRDLRIRTAAAMRKMLSLKIPPTSLWLNQKEHYPVEKDLLGLQVKYHSEKEEFVASLEYGRIVLLEQPGT